MAEGIGPAIRSGVRAADSILDGVSYRLDDVTGASLGGGWISRALDWAMTRGISPVTAPVASATTAGRQ
jgi:menaquinone-9 beta-reductase